MLRRPIRCRSSRYDTTVLRTIHGKTAVTRRLLFTRLHLSVVFIRMAAVTSNTSPMGFSASVWVFVAPLVSQLFHSVIEPNFDSTMATTRPLDMGTVANPTIAALGSLRPCRGGGEKAKHQCAVFDHSFSGSGWQGLRN